VANAQRHLRQYQPEQRVLLYTPVKHVGLGTKLLSPWSGPFVVARQRGNVVTIQTATGNMNVNVDRLRPTEAEPASAQPIPIPTTSDIPLSVGTMVIVANSVNHSLAYLARIEAPAPEPSDIIVLCYNSNSSGPLQKSKIRSFILV